MKRYFYLVMALMALVVAIGAACDGAGPSAPDATATPTSAQAPAATPTAMAAPAPTAAYTPSDDPQAAIYEALLGAIPYTPEGRFFVSIDDYTLVRQIFATTIPLPGPGDDDEAVENLNNWIPPLGYMGDASDPPVTTFGIGFLGWVNHRNINLQHLAFDVRNIDQILVTQTLGGPDPSEDVVRGRFDPQATDAALGTCSQCPEPSREEHRGVPYYSWGEDNAVNADWKFAPPAFDQLGRGERIAVLDEYVFRTLGTSEMQGLIDAHLREVPSLGDVEEFRLLAGGISPLRAYSMFLSGKVELWGLPNNAKALAGQDASQADIEAKERELAEAGPWLRPYQAFASGIGKDAEGPYMALALAHADGASAEENVGLLRRIIKEGSSSRYGTPWSDAIDVDSLEIKSEGSLLLAKLRGDIAAGGGWLDWLNWVFRVDSLILHE